MKHIARHSFEYAVIIMAVVCATTMCMLHIEQRLDPASNYQGITIMGTDAEDHYMARVREVYDGFWSAGSPYFADGKQLPSLQFPLPEWLIGEPAFLLGIDPVSAFVAAKWMTCFLLFLAFVACISSLTRTTWSALLAVTAALFATTALSSPLGILSFFHASSLDPLRFARPINPQWSCLLLFLWIWLVNRWLIVRTTAVALLSAVVLALMVYSYFYVWTYAVCAAGVLTLFLGWRRETRLIRQLLWSVLLLAVLCVPYALHMHALSTSPFYADSMQRFGLVLRHGPIVLGAWMFLLLALPFVLRSRWAESFPFLCSLGIAGVIAFNAHLITGSFLQPAHYQWYIVEPLGSALLLVALFGFVRPFVRSLSVRTTIYVLLLVACVTLGIDQQSQAYARQRTDAATEQDAAPVLQFLSMDDHPGTVVCGHNLFFLDLVPIYTGDDVCMSNFSHLTLAPMTRMRQNYFFEVWLEGLKANDALAQFMGQRRNTLSSRLFMLYYRELSGDYAAIPDTIVQEQADAYKTYAALPFAEKMKQMGADLFVITPQDVVTAQLRQVMEAGTVVYRHAGYTVVALSKENL